MRPATDEIDTCASFQLSEQRSVQRKVNLHACSDFTPEPWAMLADDGVHPDLLPGDALERRDAIDRGEAETNPLRARVDALGGDACKG